MFDYQDELDNRAEYAEGEIIAERRERNGETYCPDCDELITDDNELVEERHNPEAYGCCASCYDPTPYYPRLD